MPGVANANRGNPNDYFNSRGFWAAYIFVVGFVHYVFLSLPFLDTPMAWTLTNVTHSMVMFLYLHIEKGTPFQSMSQGREREFTVWEQMDNGMQYSESKKFFTVVPIILFFLGSFYSKYDHGHFIVNVIFLLLCIIPKLPMFHGVRLFGINKY